MKVKENEKKKTYSVISVYMFENIKNFIFFLFSLLHRSHFKNGHIYVLYVSKNSTCVVRLLLRFKAFDFF